MLKHTSGCIYNPAYRNAKGVKGHKVTFDVETSKPDIFGHTQDVVRMTCVDCGASATVTGQLDNPGPLLARDRAEVED